MMVAGLLYEFPDSAGQKFSPCCPETGVSAHPNGEHQMSQTGRIVQWFLGASLCICLKSAFVGFHIASSSWKMACGVFDVMIQFNLIQF